MHIGIITMDFQGHLHPATTLGAALKERGHRVTVIAPPPLGSLFATKQGLGYIPILVPESQSGELEQDKALLGSVEGYAAFQVTMKIIQKTIASQIRDIPSILKEHSFDGIVVDELVLPGMSIMEVHKIPYCTMANALAAMQWNDPKIPPFVTTWEYDGGYIYQLRNRLVNAFIEYIAGTSGLHPPINAYRLSNGLHPSIVPSVRNTWGNIQIAQQPECYDFPRDYEHYLPSHFFHTSPWHKEDRDKTIQFPWNQLDGRPIIYASLGTVQNKVLDTYLNIAAACASKELEDKVQLIIALGKQGATLGDNTNCPIVLPRNAVIVDYAPQIQLLKQSTMVISHCGLNTTLEAISCGIPVVAIPVANDQPGNAARLKRKGVAVIVASTSTPDAIQQAIVTVLEDPKYRMAAQTLQTQLQKEAPTIEQTAELVEFALLRGFGQPLERTDPDAIKIMGW